MGNLITKIYVLNESIRRYSFEEDKMYDAILTNDVDELDNAMLHEAEWTDSCTILYRAKGNSLEENVVQWCRDNITEIQMY